MTAPTHPGDRPSPRTFVSAFAVTAVLSALAVCAAVLLAPDSARTALVRAGVPAAIALSAAVATAVHALRSARGTRSRLESAGQEIGRLLHQQVRTAEDTRQEQQRLIDQLAEQRAELTESFTTERDRLAEENAREADRLGRENARLAGELARARRERDAAVSATSNAAARMQALATATLADLRTMEDRHGDEDVLADLLHLDHRTAQAGRLADSIAVLTGARSGRRWARPIAMESILRGAMGRIAGYRRVRVHSVSEAAVSGHAAEGVMHALAELLDNAANFSPPTAEVHVYVEEVPAGLIVSVEDSGLVMGEVQLRRAERAVAGDVTGLGGLTGTRLGLAVVGRLARKHNLTVSFRPSARGGTGVLMLIPQDILTSATPAEPVAEAPGPDLVPGLVPHPRAGAGAVADTGAGAEEPAPAAAPHAVAGPRVTESAAPEPGPAGLPKRRRGRTLADAERHSRAPRAGGTPPASGADGVKARTARFSSFREAVRPHTRPTASAPAGTERDSATDTPQPTPPQSHSTSTSAAPAGAPQSHGTGTPQPTPPHSHTADAPQGTPPRGRGAGVPQGAADTGERSPASSSDPHAHPEGDTTS
ncbi:ATP-binding protein [Streptomyces sp. NPDC048514]|uniref:ATP-binding protein n=1 Tax=Streptomyces sp. NPDC048514 TaxID=3365564 RepID=UPI003719CF63